jgi:RNA polymerase sigma-70 factor (ECF subfamily)
MEGQDNELNDEKKWLLSSREGDKEAFSFLVKRHEAKVFKLAFSVTRDREAADDLAQEAFIKAYFGLTRFKGNSAFETWLYRIALNQIRDYWRKKAKLKEIPLDSVSQKLFAQEEDVNEDKPDKGEEKKYQLVLRSVRTLPEKYRVILVLKDIQGFSYEEIARILKISQGTVNSRLHRARRMLHRRWAAVLSSGDTDTKESGA